MEVRQQNIISTFDGVVDWGEVHPLVPPNVRATALFTLIGADATAMRTYATDQDSGGAAFHTATRTRREAADALLGQMRPINKMARGLPRDQYPEVRGLFRMPKSHGYAAIISRAQSFLEAIGPVKTLFVDRGLPADFDEQLAAALVGISSHSQTRTMGNAEQVGGTAGIDAKASEGLVYLEELDSILSYAYRNDPALLAGWKAVRHVQKDPEREGNEQPAGGSQGSQPTALAKNTVTEAAVSGNGRESHLGGVEPRVNGTNGGVLVG
jgi:hypothetical protein